MSMLQLLDLLAQCFHSLHHYRVQHLLGRRHHQCRRLRRHGFVRQTLVVYDPLTSVQFVQNRLLGVALFRQ